MKRFAAVALLALGSGPLQAAGEGADGTAFGDWLVTCREAAGGGQECRMVQKLTRSDDRSLVVRFIAVPGPDGGAGLLAQVPMGVHLPAQPALRLAEPETAPSRPFVWQRCMGDVCEAGRMLSAAEVAELSAAGAFLFGYKLTRDGAPLVVQVSAAQLGAGLAAISQ